jgi:hypothetical protein
VTITTVMPRCREKIHDLFTVSRVQVTGRLVREQDGRLGYDSPRNGYPLLLAARKLVRGGVLPRLQTDRVQRLERACPPLSSRRPSVNQGKLDVFQCRGSVQEIEALENESEVMTPQQSTLVA